MQQAVLNVQPIEQLGLFADIRPLQPGEWNTFYRGGKQIKGLVKPNVKCNIRCQMSSSHICECSCGGKMHGIYAV